MEVEKNAQLVFESISEVFKCYNADKSELYDFDIHYSVCEECAIKWENRVNVDRKNR